MKAVTTQDLRDHASTDDFSKAQRSAAAAAKQMERKTFSIRSEHVRLINDTARDLSRQRDGKVVNASEALRHLLDGIES